jgi:hypothetical protein
MNAALVIGQPNFSSNTPKTTQNGLNDPLNVAFDAKGDLWVADDLNARVLEYFSPFSNGMNAALVIGEPDFTTSVGGLTQSGLHGPFATAFDETGNLWVADADYNRVMMFQSSVTIPGLTPVLVSPANGASVTTGSTVTLEVTVMSNGGAVSGATVTITVGGSQVCSTTTNAQGSASCPFKASKANHTYTWFATATKSGYTQGTSPPFTFHT